MKQIKIDGYYVRLIPENDDDLLQIGRILERANKYTVHKNGKKITYIEVPKRFVDKKDEKVKVL